jgi:hypothetical protein
VDRRIVEMIRQHFASGHSKITCRNIARRTSFSVQLVSSRISRHDLDLEWERRSHGIVVVRTETENYMYVPRADRSKRF